MARLGSKKRPLCVRVATDRRLHEIADTCDRLGLHFIAELAPGKPEDLRDFELLQRPPEPLQRQLTVGRNEPCPCGSGLKFKKCCAGASPASASKNGET